ncbi:MAG: peptidoglycan DD-metalloendopeptidase family protein [Thermodesulfobacteriota bacterium]|nr:peptidoglycan DD-metalloendopeptidase family protein [Thermodesulfobacteriota bacterium]
MEISTARHGIHDDIAGIRVQIRGCSADIQVCEDRIEKLRVVIGKSKNDLRDGWTGMYKGVFPGDLAMRPCHTELYGYLGIIIRTHLEALNGYLKELDGLEKDRARLQTRVLELKKRFGALEREKQVLSASIANNLPAAHQRMDDFVNRGSSIFSEISSRKGRLPWPVDGNIVQTFGPFKVGKVEQVSRGIDLAAKKGAVIHSVCAGRIVFVDRIPAYGYTLIIDHGGGYYSVYGHLQEAFKKRGSEVGEREVIALVGQSGDVSTPTLYFELRFHDRPQDPMEWLRQR